MKKIQEKVHVFARSIRGSLEPLQFIWRSQKFSIREILSMQKKIHRKPAVYHFNVRTIPEGKYELEFDLKSGQWYLIQGSPGGDP